MAAVDSALSPTPSGLRSSQGPAVTVPHLSFATDLLFNLDEVRAGCSRGLTTQSNVVALLKNRIALERHYANELSRFTQQSHLEELEHGTMQEALGKLKAQYLNTSVQHRILANNLEEDVLRPIEALYTYNNDKAQNLAKLVNNIKKQAKVHEDEYKRDCQAFDKGFREATTQFAAAMDAGFSSTMIEHQYHIQLAEIEMGMDDADRMQSMMAFSGMGSPPGGRPRQKSAAAIQTINNNSQKLVNWLLASDQQRKENVYVKAVQVLEAAEVSRRKCLHSWENVEQSRLDMYRTLQSVLTEYQQIAEHRISNLATNLRKHVVFESSTLANEQYDWQMIASKIENVDFEGDIREFIMEHFSHDLETMTVNDLCHVAASSSLVFSPNSTPCRPLKKVPLQISDLAVRRIPYDHEGNQGPLRQVLVTRSTPAAKAKTPSPLKESKTAAMISLLSESPPSSPRGRLTIHIPSPKKPDVHDISHYRVCLAQDVARAITRAYELRSVQKNSLQSPFYEPEMQSLEPENNTTDPMSPTSVDEAEPSPPTAPMGVDSDSELPLMRADGDPNLPQTNDSDQEHDAIIDQSPVKLPQDASPDETEDQTLESTIEV